MHGTGGWESACRAVSAVGAVGTPVRAMVTDMVIGVEAAVRLSLMARSVGLIGLATGSSMTLGTGSADAVALIAQHSTTTVAYFNWIGLSRQSDTAAVGTLLWVPVVRQLML